MNPMVRIVPPFSANFLQLGNGLRHRDASEPAAEFGRNRLGGRLRAEAAAAAAPAVAQRNAAVDEHEHVVLRVQVAGVERAGEHDLERELDCSNSHRVQPDGIDPPY